MAFPIWPCYGFGETISVAEGVMNPWLLVGHVSAVLLVVFMADAMLTVLRRGDRWQLRC